MNDNAGVTERSVVVKMSGKRVQIYYFNGGIIGNSDDKDRGSEGGKEADIYSAIKA